MVNNSENPCVGMCNYLVFAMPARYSRIFDFDTKELALGDAAYFRENLFPRKEEMCASDLKRLNSNPLIGSRNLDYFLPHLDYFSNSA